jgi:DNA-directed RNA polymerase I, II, and III subunit RPABC1
MVEARIIWRARNNVARMLQDRGYQIPEHEVSLSEEEVQRRLSLPDGNGHIDLVVERPSDGRRMVAWFYEPGSPQRSRPMNLSQLRDTVSDCIRQCGSEEDPTPENVDVLLVLGPDDEKNARTDEDHVHKAEFAYRGRVEVWWCKELTFPIADHYLQSKVHVLVGSEREEFLRTHYIEPRDLQRMRDRDPIARYYKLHRGQIIRFERPDGRTVGFRIIE